MNNSSKPYYLVRQLATYYKPLIEKNFPGEIIYPIKIIIENDHYLIKTRYRKSYLGPIKVGMFKIFDDGSIMPAIIPDKCWNFAV